MALKLPKLSAINLILSMSLILFDIKISDQFINEILSGSKKIINDYLPESKFLEISGIDYNMKDFQLHFFNERVMGESIRNSIQHNVIIIKLNDFDSINELIELSEKNEITHLVVDLEKNRGEVLIEIYNNEKQFPFLDKIFDSDQYEFDYKMKVFKIDYEKFDKLN